MRNDVPIKRKLSGAADKRSSIVTVATLVAVAWV